MKRVTVTPLKTVNGVHFGDTRASVRKEFGKYKEFKKTKNSSNSSDDFGWCHAFYDANGKLEAVELFTAECRIVVGSTQIDTSSLATAKKGLGITDSTDKNRSIGISESNGKVAALLFGKRDYYGEDKKEEKTEVKKESAEDDEFKTLSDILGPEEARKHMDAEKAQREQSINSLRAAADAGTAKMKATTDSFVKDTANLASKYFGTPKAEDGGDLMKFYDDLKNQLNSNPAGTPPEGMIRVGTPTTTGLPTPGAQAFRQKATIECDKLKDKCCKHLILDIYCKVLPLDGEFVLGNRGMLSSDVDSMLASKGMSASQYLTSCSEKTKAPLLEFVLRSVDNIGKAFMEEAKEKLKDAQEQEIDVPAPEAPDPEESEDVASQLVDVKKDTEYENFIDKLKEKTIKKIVSDVSKIISDKKEEKDMTFDPQPDAVGAGDTKAEAVPAEGDEAPALESTTSVAIDFLQAKLLSEGVQIDANAQENMIGMAIREATLNEINACFRQPDTDLRPFTTRVRMGRGYVINESTAAAFMESVRQ